MNGYSRHEIVQHRGRQRLIRIQVVSESYLSYYNGYRLSWLTKSATYLSPNTEGEGGGCRVSANVYSCTHEAQINFVDITSHLTYGWERIC